MTFTYLTNEMVKDYEEYDMERGSRSVKYGNVIDELVSEYSRGQKESFDNYGAIPVKPKAYLEAFNFIKHFPLDLLEALPEVYLDPQGGIGFDWENEDGNSSFAVNFAGEGIVYYAGLFKNGGKVRGSEYFFGDDIPKEIIDYVLKVYR